MMQIFIDVLKIIISITVVDCLLMGILHPYFAKKVSERRHRGLIWLTAVKAAITGGSAMRSFEGSGILPCGKCLCTDIPFSEYPPPMPPVKALTGMLQKDKISSPRFHKYFLPGGVRRQGCRRR